MILTDLPAVNASLNGLSAVCLGLGFWSVKTGRIQLHRVCMLAAVALSTLFLVSYLYYHFHVGSVRFQRAGWIRPIYFTVLISHTILAVLNVPLVARALYLAFRERFEEHKKAARYAWPVWMYVSVTGVCVYWMLYRL